MHDYPEYIADDYNPQSTSCIVLSHPALAQGIPSTPPAHPDVGSRTVIPGTPPHACSDLQQPLRAVVRRCVPRCSRSDIYTCPACRRRACHILFRMWSRARWVCRRRGRSHGPLAVLRLALWPAVHVDPFTAYRTSQRSIPACMLRRVKSV